MEENVLKDPAIVAEEIAGTNLPNSTERTFRLISFKPESYAGIHKGMDLVIFFNDKDKKVGFTGDQGTCKTSALACIKYMLGGEDAENAINSTDKNKKAELVFEREGVTYMVKATKAGFEIKKGDKVGDRQITSKVEKPRETLKELVGPLGISPMFLKEMDGKKQIAWIRSLYAFSEEQLKDEKEINTKMQQAEDERAGYNREVKRLRGDLVQSGLYRWDEKQKVLEPTSKFNEDESKYKLDNKEKDEEVNRIFEEKTKQHTQYQNMLTEKKNLAEKKEKYNTEIQKIEREIEQLKERLAKGKAELAMVETDIESLDVKITEGASIVQELAEAQKAFSDLGDYKVGKAEFERLKKLHADHNNNEQLYVNADGKLEAYRKLKKEFIKSFTPDIEGLEICVPGVVDVAKERELYLQANEGATDEQVEAYIDTLKSEYREGIFYYKKSLAQLCESELWSLFFKLCKVLKVRVVIVENVNVLGSEAIQQLNDFDGWVFYSAMQRNQPYKIEFHEKIS